jgi:hypothetical protein
MHATVTIVLALATLGGTTKIEMILSIDIESLQNRLLKVYVPATSAPLNRLLFFLLRPLTVLMKHTRQAVLAVKQTILLRCL